MIEDQLRTTFSERVGDPPAVLDLAGSAIRRAGRIRRRRRQVVAAVLTVLAVAVASGGWRLGTEWTAGGTGQPSRPGASSPVSGAEPAPSTRGVSPVDRWDDSTLWTVDGRHYQLPGAGRYVQWVEATQHGWLYGRSDDRLRTHAYLLRPDGSSTNLGLDTEQVIVSSDGARVAWHQYGTDVPASVIVVGDLGPDGIPVRGRLDAPTGTLPARFLGRYLLLHGQADPAHATFDLWLPGDTFTPSGNDQIADVYGAVGNDAVGLVFADSRRDQTCLARFTLDPRGLHEQRRACVSDLGANPPGRLSPDGRWLAIGTRRGQLLFELATVFDRPVPAVTCPTSANPSYLSWEGSTALVFYDLTGATLRCGTDGSVVQVKPPQPGGSPSR